MQDPSAEFRQKVCQQYDFVPYPGHPIAKSVQDESDFLALHDISKAYALAQQAPTDTHGKVILDAGCGTGWTSLALATANPGAEIIGIDLSPKSIEIAQQRLRHHGFENAFFKALPIEELPSLTLTFDYINCDQTLFFLPDPLVGLQAMKAVLKPQGVIRANLHSALQRAACFRAQQVFQMLGLLNDNPAEMEAGVALEIMEALDPEVDLKAQVWSAMQNDSDADKICFLLRDLLVQGDKGYTIPELFTLLAAANLSFVSMVNPQNWELLNLFTEPDNPPIYLAYALEDLTIQDQLHLFELLHPVHRLLDFWCTHSD